MKTDICIHIPEELEPLVVCGPADTNLRIIEKYFPVQITGRHRDLCLSGHAQTMDLVTKLIYEVFNQLQQGLNLNEDELTRLCKLFSQETALSNELHSDLILSYKGRVIRPKTAGQKTYVDAIRKHIITFGLGPAGTGKTYLAVALALSALETKEVGRLVLSRPVVEAGESLGFLPGSLEEKVDPYIRPLYDALFSMADPDRIRRYIESGQIEICPLAFMRGRSLNDAFIILDEAQNTTPEQMKMFLTRLGFNSKMVVTGDLSQNDLPRGRSGLAALSDILGGLKEIEFCTLSSHDVVRHNLVADIVLAYDHYDQKS